MPSLSPGPAAGGLSLSGITVERGGRVVLSAVSAQVLPGAVLAVIGPNGSGKSSLAMAGAGLLPLRTGTVRVEGAALTQLPARERARLVGYVPQRSELQVPLPVRAVVAMGRHAHGSAAWPDMSASTTAAVHEALALVDAGHLAERVFLSLSGGERQRVLIARALAGAAGVLVLDEPTSALDIGHRLAVLQLVRRLAAQGKAVLVTLHELNDVARVADQALLLAAGVQVVAGTPQEVLAPATIRSVYGVELRAGAGYDYQLPGQPG